MEPYKHECLNRCGKIVINYDSRKSGFCSRECETNYRYTTRNLKTPNGRPMPMNE